MRDLIVSTIAVSLLIGAWLVFYNYSEKQIDSFTASIENELIPAVEAGRWEESVSQTENLSQRWHKYRKTALLFIDTVTLNEIDYTLAKSEKYILNKDIAGASGELYAMHQQLVFLSSNDRVIVSNIL